jgi:hypothetical protein
MNPIKVIPKKVLAELKSLQKIQISLSVWLK